MASRGRPSGYKKEFAKQAQKLCELGATPEEVDLFLASDPSADDFASYWLTIYREDRLGFIAHRKRKRCEAQRHIRRQPSKRIENSVRARMWAALKGKSEGKLLQRLGYTISELRRHLEKQFSEGMSWENYGQWHIDHIVPCAAFDMTDKQSFQQCWALENLQPLWASDNIQKGAKHGSA